MDLLHFLDGMVAGGQLADRAAAHAEAVAPLDFLVDAQANNRAVAFAPRGVKVGMPRRHAGSACALLVMRHLHGVSQHGRSRATCQFSTGAYQCADLAVPKQRVA